MASVAFFPSVMLLIYNIIDIIHIYVFLLLGIRVDSITSFLLNTKQSCGFSWRKLQTSSFWSVTWHGKPGARGSHAIPNK